MRGNVDETIIKMCIGTGNWGDAVNPFFVELITGKKPKAISIHEKFSGPNPSYLIIGSVLGFADSNSIIWGAGFIKYKEECREKPLKVCAVRGPLSREALLQSGIDCPNIFGDPILLMPKFYTPNVDKKYEIGIIPHFIDKENPWLESLRDDGRVNVIDIQNVENGFYEVIDQVCSCKRIISSSLHGVILADAYGIPSLWMELSDKVLGHGFKFRDYFLSVGRKDGDPLRIDPNTSIEQILNKFYDYKINIDLDKLWNACPLPHDKNLS